MKIVRIRMGLGMVGGVLALLYGAATNNALLFVAGAVAALLHLPIIDIASDD